MVAVAIGGAAILGAGSSIISGNKAAKAQTKAADTAAESTLTASREANELQKYMYDTTRGDYAPYREVGYGALGKLAGMYGVQRTNADGTAASGSPAASTEPYGGFQASPGYQFRVDEATKAIERSAAARGSLRSGATMDALQRRVQGVASDEYENYANRLAALAGVGQSATGSTAAAGSNYATAAGGNIMSAGQSAANSAMAAGNARASAYANTGSAINSGVQNLTSMYLYNKGYGGVGGGYASGLPGSPTSVGYGTY